MAKALKFKDFINVDYTQTGDDQLAYRAKKRKTADTEHEALNFAARRKLARSLKKNKAKIAIGRKKLHVSLRIWRNSRNVQTNKHVTCSSRS